MINVQNITRVYTEGIVTTKALNDVSFRVAQGEFVGLMGRSGSGKSTLLHQLGLLDVPTSGSISINGVPLSTLSPEEKTDFRLTKIGYVFQEYGLISEFTALENVMFPRMAMIDGTDQEKAKELLEYVGLKERLHHYPDEMSGGEKQRVAIARALINDPSIIIADEPTANLDSVSTDAVLTLFKRMHLEFKKTIIMVTHEESDKKYMDRIIVLKDGQIISEETALPQERKGTPGILRP